MSEQNKISKQMSEIDKILHQIEDGEIPLEEITKKYQEAILKAENLKEELSKIENKIVVLSKNFEQR